jgi:hypothetical protein
MKIRYVNTMEDIVAFNWYHLRHSPASWRVVQHWTWALAFLFLLLGAPLVITASEPGARFIGVAFAVGGAVGSVVLYRLSLPYTFKRNVRRMFSEGQNKGMVGPHELELVADRLVDTTPYGEYTTVLEAVEKVVSTDAHTFIYVSAAGAHVIPRQAVDEGDLQAFVSAVQLRLANARQK